MTSKEEEAKILAPSDTQALESAATQGARIGLASSKTMTFPNVSQ